MNPDDKDQTTARRAGMAKMKEVYGWNVDPDEIAGPYVDVTVDHLFGEIWTRPGLALRDRRLLTIGALAALGLPHLLDIQFTAAFEREELTEIEARELVVHLAHYVGWPLSTGLNASVEKIIARRAKAAAQQQDGGDDD